MRRRKNRLVAASAAVLSLLLALVTYLAVQNGARLRSGSSAGDHKSIAVLPFVDLSPAKDQEYFGDGITEELINALAQVHDLRVVARTSSFAFKGTSTDIRTIGHRLGVGTLLEGSVRKAGTRLRIAARLIDVSNGYDLWSETYEREAGDLFAIQDDISRAIVSTLNVTLATGENAPLRQRSTKDLDAYNAYLKGRYFWNQRTESGLKQGIEYFEEAIRQDPSFAAAYAGLADSYLMLRVWGYLPRGDAIPAAKRAGLRALELYPSLGEAHASLALIRWWDERDFAGAESEFKRAIQLNPGYATAHHWYSLYLSAIGAMERGLTEIRLAQNLDPLSRIISTILGTRLYFARRYEDAVEQYRRALVLDPSYGQAHLWLGMVYARTGRTADALGELRRVGSDSAGDPIPRAALAYALAVSGRRAEARAMTAELEQRSRRRYVSPYWIAVAYAGLGDKDHALAWLERAYDDHDGWLLNLKVDPAFDPLRSDSRVVGLLRKLGLRG